MSLKIKFTDTGKAALINPANIGTNALNITTIKVGTASYDPDGTEVDLQAPIKFLNTFGGETVANDIIHVTIRDDSSDTYNIGEIGLFSGDSTLMGVISSVINPIITQKGMNDVLLLSADAAITEVDVTNLTFGGTEFIYSPATPNNAGIIEVADQAEVDAGIRNKAIDAYELQQLINRRLTPSLTENDPTKFAAAKAVYDLKQAINNINSLLTSDESTLDSLQEIVDYIQINKNDLESLNIAAISGLQTALDAKSNSHSHPYAATVHGHTISDVAGLQAALNSAGDDLSVATTVWSGSTSGGVNISAHGPGLYSIFIGGGYWCVSIYIENMTDQFYECGSTDPGMNIIVNTGVVTSSSTLSQAETIKEIKKVG
jgi:hypothetical protein